MIENEVGIHSVISQFYLDEVRTIELAYIDAPSLPSPENSKPKTELEEMEDFLDDLLG